MNENIKNRCSKFLNELKLPATRLCRLVDLSASSFYKWQRGDLRLSENTLKRIDDCLARFGF